MQELFQPSSSIFHVLILTTFDIAPLYKKLSSPAVSVYGIDPPAIQPCLEAGQLFLWPIVPRSTRHQPFPAYKPHVPLIPTPPNPPNFQPLLVFSNIFQPGSWKPAQPFSYFPFYTRGCSLHSSLEGDNCFPWTDPRSRATLSNAFPVHPASFCVSYLYLWYSFSLVLICICICIYEPTEVPCYALQCIHCILLP